jgi:hypothetical protein
LHLKILSASYSKPWTVNKERQLIRICHREVRYKARLKRKLNEGKIKGENNLDGQLLEADDHSKPEIFLSLLDSNQASRLKEGDQVLGLHQPVEEKGSLEKLTFRARLLQTIHSHLDGK